MEAKGVASPPQQLYYTLKVDEVFKVLNTSDAGLSDEEAVKRQKEYGFNRLTSKKKISAISIYLEQFKNTLTLILIGSALLILFIYYFGNKDQSDLIEAGLILAIIFMITILGFIQEYKAEKSIEQLKKLLAFKAKVKRNNIEKEINVADLVPGDIVILEEGEKVPADIRLAQVFSMSVNEASLTGESNPVSKTQEHIASKKEIADQNNMVFSGTAISSGRAIGIVVQIGDRTEIGKIAGLVAGSDDDETPIQKRLDKIGKFIGYAVLGVCSIVFVFIVFFAHDFDQLPLLQKVINSFVASVALAVAAIPEGLPAVVTIALALGTQRMLKKNALVRKLNSVETLGSVDVICSDKTGTLTKGEMTVKQIYFDSTTYEVEGTGYEAAGEFSINGKKTAPEVLTNLLLCGAICNNASLTGDNKVLGDPTEAALLVSAAKANLHVTGQRVHEIPFNSERKMMSVVIQEKDNYVVYAKGAPEIVLAKCTKTIKNGKESTISEQDRNIILAKTQEMSSKALRDLGFAYKRMSQEEFNKKSSEQMLEQDLVFLGIQGMIDPARTEVAPLIASCKESGIRVIMITGDHIETAKAVAKEIGIIGEAMTGEQLDKLSDDEFSKIIESVSIYARVNPGFKMRIVDHLKLKGHIVAMTGDGVNDAPALKRADIGIAMGITGTDVAKEASDMVLLDDHFSTIIAAIEEGRGIFHNIRKFVMYLLTCNIGEVILVFLAVLLFKEVPLSATMLLWVNVVTDGLPAVALGLDPAEKGIMRYSPKIFQSQIIEKKMWIEMAIFGFLLALGVLGIYIWNLSEGVHEAQGAAFTAIVFFELVQLTLVRSAYKTSFFSNAWLIVAVCTTLFLQVLIVYVPFLAHLFDIRHIDLNDWIYIIVVGSLLWITMKLLRILFKFTQVSSSTKIIESVSLPQKS